MQFHYNCLRGVNRKMNSLLGPDTGYDMINTATCGGQIAALLSALNVNYDISVMSQMSRIMDGLLRTDATLQTSLFGTGNSMEEVFESCSEMVKRPFSQMQKADRLTLVSILKEKGFFQMQRSVPYAAERLGVTKYTIYNYLNELGGV